MVDIFGIPFNLVIPDGGAGGEQGTGAREAQKVRSNQQVLRAKNPRLSRAGSPVSLVRARPPWELLPVGRETQGVRKALRGRGAVATYPRRSRMLVPLGLRGWSAPKPFTKGLPRKLPAGHAACFVRVSSRAKV